MKKEALMSNLALGLALGLDQPVTPKECHKTPQQKEKEELERNISILKNQVTKEMLEEYPKIIAKESNLSSKERKRIVNTIEYNAKRIKEYNFKLKQILKTQQNGLS